MKTRAVISTLAILIALAAFPCANASASTIDFGDDSIIWPGAHTYTSLHDDTNGFPDLLGGSFTFAGHTLTTITLDYVLNEKNVSRRDWNSIRSGDWFFDFNEDDVWDVVVHNNGRDGYDLYSGSWEYGSNGYSHSDYQFADEWNERLGHPTYAKTRGAEEIGDATFNGWRSYDEVRGDHFNPAPIVSSVWTLSLDLSQYAGHSIRYGYTISCANDVLFGQITAPAPEPGTMVLAGLGLLGLAGLRRWKRIRIA